jgi:hypothetical protein
MKKTDAAELKKIAYNCRKATYLIEKQQSTNISLKEKLELKIHLAGCALCVTFMQQSAIINQMARKIFIHEKPELKMDKNFKKQLQIRIERQLDKN